MYEAFLKGEPLSKYFRLNENSDLHGIDISIYGISNEPIAEGSYINVANIEV